MIKVKGALISVSDKNGLVEFARGLQKLGIEIISTGGTAKLLKNAKIPVVEVSEYTGFPEMLDGRVKTLHPTIHGGLLALRDNSEHMEQIKKYNIGLIDMVVVNLYPFEKVIQKKNVSNEEAIETARQLMLKEGILAGISCGAAVAAALRVAAQAQQP